MPEAISSGANHPEAAGSRGGPGRGVDGGADRSLFSACESRFAGFDDVNNSVIGAFGTRNATLAGEWEDGHGNARVCACSRLEATPAIVISRRCVRLRACVPSEGTGLSAWRLIRVRGNTIGPSQTAMPSNFPPVKLAT